MSNAVFPVTYLAPVSHFAAILKFDEIRWDIHEHYHKQYYYNRCTIYGPNGAQKLTIPIHKRHERTPLKEVEICYDVPWQKIHWRSFEAAYRRSPYFEFYEHDLYPLYMEDYQPNSLVDWNIKLFELICRLLGVEKKLKFTNEYSKTYEDASDYRALAIPALSIWANNNSPQSIKYHQVFEERHGFLSDLSIIDLLFCEGPKALDNLALKG